MKKISIVCNKDHRAKSPLDRTPGETSPGPRVPRRVTGNWLRKTKREKKNKKIWLTRSVL